MHKRINNRKSAHSKLKRESFRNNRLSAKRESLRNSRLSAKRGSYRSRRLGEAYGTDVGDVACFSDLNSQQKDYVISNLYKMGALDLEIQSAYSDLAYDDYNYCLEDIVDRYEKLGIGINTQYIYWQSSSHGPYAEHWDLSKILDNCYIGKVNNRIDDLEVSFTGDVPEDVNNYAVISFYDTEKGDDFYFDFSDIFPDDIGKDAYDKVCRVIDVAQDAINEIWDLICETASGYPDDEWIEQYLMNDDRTAFEIISDTQVRLAID